MSNFAKIFFQHYIKKLKYRLRYYVFGKKKAALEKNIKKIKKSLAIC